MSVWFIDVHSEYQAGLDFKRVKRLGYSAAIIKATQGTSYVPSGLKEFAAGAQRAGLLIGFYHFLDASDGDRQAAHFVQKVNDLGGAQGRLLAVDFEQHPNPSQTATNKALRDFVVGVKKRTNNHAVILYSGYGFWTGGDSSGNARDYGIDAIWEARYADLARHDFPRIYYRQIKGWYDKQASWGGMEPAAWQFTSAGRVAGQYIDCDRFFGSKDDLMKLMTRGAPKPDPTPEPSRLERNIDTVKRYGLDLLEHHPKYWCWDGGSLDRNVAGRPGCHDGPPPPMSEIKKLFCADLITLMLRKLGKPVPKNGIYPGGTRSFQLKYGDKMKRFNLLELREGDVAFVDFQNAHAPEGHIGFCLGDGPNARFLQSYADSCATLEPGLNAKWTIRESHDGFYYTHYIPREVIWGNE